MAVGFMGLFRRMERRSGRDRRSDPPERPGSEERRSERDRRRDPRRQVPFGAWALSGVLRSEQGQTAAIHVWDLSRRGACLVIRGSWSPAVDQRLRLTLFDETQFNSLEVRLDVRWTFNEGGENFVGVQLVGGLVWPRDTFLSPYLEATWAEGEPTLDLAEFTAAMADSLRLPAD